MRNFSPVTKIRKAIGSPGSFVSEIPSSIFYELGKITYYVILSGLILILAVVPVASIVFPFSIGSKIKKTNIRVIAATNKDLKAMVEKEEFREDLFYRLNVFPIYIPPLRERKGDIPLLLNHFLELYSLKTGTPTKKFAKRAVDALMKYHWPGNVRELENLVERLCTVTRKKIIYIQDVYSPNLGLKKYRGQKLKDAVGNFERKYVLDVLESVDWSRKKAAERLGIHRNTLLDKMNELDIKIE